MKIKIIVFIAAFCLGSSACPGFAEVLGSSPWTGGDTYAREGLKAVVKATAQERFKDNKDGTVTDLTTGLMWMKEGRDLDLNLKAVTWYEAAKRCLELNFAGYTDWRLPTIGEWITIIDPKKESPALVEPNPFKNMIAHYPYWAKDDFIYGADYTCIKNVCPIESKTVWLYYGNVGHQNKGSNAFIFPVRIAKKAGIIRDKALIIDMRYSLGK